MDIAEIRKKAKSQGKVDGLNCEPAEEHGPELASEVHEEQNDPDTIPESPAHLAVFEDVSTPPRQAADGLNQLFAATEDFGLATDESYADILDTQADAQTQSRCQYLAFHLYDEEYALDIGRISEIIKVREFTDIPRAPEFILGIISLRGVVVPVFDLRLRLKLGVSELTSASRIVVCQLDDVTVGLLVDSINQVISLTENEIEPPPGVLSGLDREMVSGIGRYQGRMIILLNLQSALDVEQMQE